VQFRSRVKIFRLFGLAFFRTETHWRSRGKSQSLTSDEGAVDEHLSELKGLRSDLSRLLLANQQLHDVVVRAFQTLSLNRPR